MFGKRIQLGIGYHTRYFIGFFHLVWLFPVGQIPYISAVPETSWFVSIFLVAR
jgi:hypothetical protein